LEGNPQSVEAGLRQLRLLPWGKDKDNKHAEDKDQDGDKHKGKKTKKKEQGKKTKKKEEEDGFTAGQHDMVEFLRPVLEFLGKETAQIPLTPDASEVDEGGIIEQLFRCWYRETRVCENGHTTVVRGESELVLSLPIPLLPPWQAVHLEDCLRAFVHPQLDGASLSHCEGCGAKVKATITQPLWLLPPVLIIHFRRYDWNWQLGRADKVTTPISFPSRLTLGDDLTVGLAAKYNLLAMAQHHGAGTSGGHYTAYVRSGDVWHLCSDETIAACSSIPDAANPRVCVLVYQRAAASDGP
jgi:uncharacterized UBP type Zn finger protein